MMRGLTAMLEKHHNVRILDEAVEASVKLSRRYISGRQLPDKSVSLLDTACARVAIGQSAIPPAVEDGRRQIDHLKVEIGILERENATLLRHDERLAEQADELARTEARLAELEKRWEQERSLVEQIRAWPTGSSSSTPHSRGRPRATSRYSPRPNWRSCEPNSTPRRPSCGRCRASRRWCRSASMPKRSPR